jgi:hypothetical protein
MRFSLAFTAGKHFDAPTGRLWAIDLHTEGHATRYTGGGR